MDIRSIKTPVPEVKEGAYLEEMYFLQKELMDGYIKIEGLPRYPLNINNKKAQVVLKDFCGRVTEELAEGYESTHLAIKLLSEQGFNIDRLSPTDRSMVYNHLQNSNEEQADATAFFIELMIYADITPSDFYKFIEAENLVPKVQCDGLLANLMLIGVYLLSKDNNLLLEDTYLKYNILDKEAFPSEDEYLRVKSYTPGFIEISEYSHQIEPIMLWQICYHIGVGRNYLKNKPWKQSGELTDEAPFIREIMLGFIKYMGYLHINGFNPQDLYNLFWRKNQVNRFRQRSNY